MLCRSCQPHAELLQGIYLGKTRHLFKHPRKPRLSLLHHAGQFQLLLPARMMPLEDSGAGEMGRVALSKMWQDMSCSTQDMFLATGCRLQLVSRRLSLTALWQTPDIRWVLKVRISDVCVHHVAQLLCRSSSAAQTVFFNTFRAADLS